MANEFLAGNIIPQQAYERAKSLAWDIKNFCEAQSLAAESDMSAGVVIGIMDRLRIASIGLNEVKDTPGILEYAQVQEDDPTYDVAAAFLNMLGLIDTAAVNIGASLPTDAQGNVLVAKVNVNILEWNIWPASALVDMKADLDLIAASIVSVLPA